MCLSFYHEAACQVEHLLGRDHPHHCHRGRCCPEQRLTRWSLRQAGQKEMGGLLQAGLPQAGLLQAVLPQAGLQQADRKERGGLPRDFFLLPLVFLCLPQLPPIGAEATGLDLVDVVGWMVLVCWGVGWWVDPCRWRRGPCARGGYASSAGTGGGAAGAAWGWAGRGRGEPGAGMCTILLLIQTFSSSCCCPTQSWLRMSQFSTSWQWGVWSSDPVKAWYLRDYNILKDLWMIEVLQPALFTDQLWLDGKDGRWRI